MTERAPRVLWVTDHGDTLNSVRPEAEILIGCRAAGLDMEIMTQPDTLYRDRLAAAGVPIHPTVVRKKFDRHAVRALRELLVARAYDIVHLFNNRAIVTGVRAARGLPVKVVTYRGQTGNIHRFDPTCYLTHLHPRVDAITCVADSVRQDLARHLRDPSKAVTIYKGHDLAWYDDAPVDLAQFGLDTEDFVVGAVANLRPRKGLEFLIDAMAHIPEPAPVKVLLVGGGVDSDKVRAAVDRFPGRFALAGFRTDAPAIVAACQASVLAATKREGLPKTVIESMAYGVTPIVTDTGGSAELVEHGVSGLVIPPRDSRAIAEAILTLWRDPARNAEMGRRARVRIATHFNVRESIERHVAFYRGLCGRGFSPDLGFNRG